MADVAQRMLDLLSTLQTGRAFTGEELTRRLGVSPRTLRRDVDRLRGYGYPVDTRPGPGGYYRLAAGRTMPPLVLDDDEAVATLLALASLAATEPPDGGPANGRGTGEPGGGPAPDGPARDGAGPGVQEAAGSGIDDAAMRAYGKLDQYLPARLRLRLASIRSSLETSPQHAPSVAAGRLGLLAEAIARHETVTFTYTDARGEVTGRRVEPYRQVHHLLRWYLLAWDTGREDWRTFRLDRISGVQRTGELYEPRPLPAGSAAEYLRQGLGKGKQSVTVVVEAPAADVADALKFQDAEIRPLDGGRTRITLALDSWQWLVLHLAFLDADFSLSAEGPFAAACRDFGQRLVAAASPGSAGSPGAAASPGGSGSPADPGSPPQD